MTFSRPRLLIAEDDAIIAMDIEATFADLGFDVVVTTEVDQADVRLSTESWDCVILDGTLRNQSSTPLGKTCGQRRIPLVIYSGQADAELREAFPAAFIVAKPAVGDDLVTAVQMAMGKLGQIGFSRPDLTRQAIVPLGGLKFIEKYWPGLSPEAEEQLRLVKAWKERGT